jgi:hypothetical protein
VTGPSDPVDAHARAAIVRPVRHAARLLLLLTTWPLLTACAGDDGASASATTSGPVDTSDTSATSDTTTTGDTTTTSDTTTTTTTTDTTDTTGADYCAGWQDAPPPAYLELRSVTDEPLQPGSTLPLECGPQGLFMFGLYPSFGGFTPTSDALEFTITVDVEGFNDNPAGHFFSGPVGYYIGCDPVIGGVVGVLPVIPWDEITDLTELDGKPAQIQVVMHAPSGDVTLDFAVVLAAVPSDAWGFCGG